eukprot:gb/GEZN01004126.1/.p1 GENE.gb/GEZN01004126.1/~~gb/GEZN01004126.1/.p1  ORF type:complete len:632 (+),score=73.72 gb/GEZN01004126.1/:10-1905(+)
MKNCKVTFQGRTKEIEIPPQASREAVLCVLIDAFGIQENSQRFIMQEEDGADVVIDCMLSPGAYKLSALPTPDSFSSFSLPYLDLGLHHMPICTQSPDAQLWFDRGLVNCFAFNHEEAITCFELVQKADSNCAMALWGIAHALGSNYNNQAVEDQAYARAYACNQAAQRLCLISSDTPDPARSLQKWLVQAQEKRYPRADATSAEREIANKRYSEVMREVVQIFPNHPDVLCLFAEAAMNLRPWKLWEQKQMAPGTKEIVETLDRGLVLAPDHPGLLHLYIHAMEMCPEPGGGAEQVADRLIDKAKDAGHLQHMPSHIYVQIGRYQDCIKCNRRGIEADNRYVALRGKENFFTVYRLHNYHFLSWSSMLAGNYSNAIVAASQIQKEIPESFLTEGHEMLNWVEMFCGLHWHVLVRFGRWKDIVEKPLPIDQKVFASTTALALYAKGIAHASMGNVEAAKADAAMFERVLKTVPSGRVLFNNTAQEILTIAQTMLEGEILYRAGQADEAFTVLRKAAGLEMGLPYEEPWGWMQPVRHALAALLLEQDRVAEAEQEYRMDLARYPLNIWSLHGLEECLRLQGKTKTEMYGRVSQWLQEAQKYSDVKISASCFCRLSAIPAQDKAQSCCNEATD